MKQRRICLFFTLTLGKDLAKVRVVIEKCSNKTTPQELIPRKVVLEGDPPNKWSYLRNFELDTILLLFDLRNVHQHFLVVSWDWDPQNPLAAAGQQRRPFMFHPLLRGIPHFRGFRCHSVPKDSALILTGQWGGQTKDTQKYDMSFQMGKRDPHI